jgi:N-acylglucosamine-6-phosphate 2-epimerase
MADVATSAEGKNAEQIGANFIGTTLSGYTKETEHILSADFDLVENLAKSVSVPVICEGRLKTPEDVRRAFDCGAFAVVVGGAITGIDLLVKEFVAGTKQ